MTLLMLIGSLIMFSSSESRKFACLGYVSYLSYLHVEHTFGNPVLVVFVKLLNLSTQWDEFGKIQNGKSY